MALQSGFFRSIGGDRVYKAEFFASYFSSFIGNGVFPSPSTGLQVIADTNFNVSVQSGKGWINGYYLVNNDNYILTLDGADGALSRIDRIVMGWNTETRLIDIYVKKGSPSTNPVAPSIQRDATIYELVLADVRINNGVLSISQSAITDQRFNSNLCGIVAGTVNQIDTTNLFAQYQSSFDQFFNQIQDVLDENAAGNLLSLINDLEGRVSGVEGIPASIGQPDGLAQLNSQGFLEYSQFNNIVTGTYTGTGSATREIDLGFRPKAVLVYPKNSSLVAATSNGIYGGLAIDNFPATSFDASRSAVAITANGFTVYSASVGNNASVFTNTTAATSNPFRYVAFR